MKFVAKKFSDGIEYWTISRPERRNAIGLAIADEILQLAQNLSVKFRDAGISRPISDTKQLPRALVIRATPCLSAQSGRVWIAGGDLKELATLNNSAARDYAYAMTSACSMLERLPIPVIAVLEGAAIGGGAEFFLAADIRIATEDSSLEFRQLSVGLCCGYGGTARLIRLCGYGHSQRLIMTGASVNTTEAMSLGLIHFCCKESAEVESCCADILKKWSRTSRHALAAQKELFVQSWQTNSQMQTCEELRIFTSVWKNPEHLQFLSQFSS